MSSRAAMRNSRLRPGACQASWKSINAGAPSFWTRILGSLARSLCTTLAWCSLRNNCAAALKYRGSCGRPSHMGTPAMKLRSSCVLPLVRQRGTPSIPVNAANARASRRNSRRASQATHQRAGRESRRISVSPPVWVFQTSPNRSFFSSRLTCTGGRPAKCREYSKAWE